MFRYSARFVTRRAALSVGGKSFTDVFNAGFSFAESLPRNKKEGVFVYGAKFFVYRGKFFVCESLFIVCAEGVFVCGTVLFVYESRPQRSSARD